MDLREVIAQLIQIEGISSVEIKDLIVPNVDVNMGDYALPCFKIAKVMRKSPKEIAEAIVGNIKENEYINKCEAVNGYINFYLNADKIAKSILEEILSVDEEYGSGKEGVGKTICIDYSSVNIAKPFHIGHLGTTAIGSSLYKIYTFLGYKVVGINHLGDWGTQFGRMIVAFKLWGDRDEVDKEGVKALARYYTRFHIEVEERPELGDQARDWFVRIENGDEEAVSLFNYFKEITLKDVSQVYGRLNVKFDSWLGESFYSDRIPATLDGLRKKNLTTISDGAEIVDLSEYKMAPCLLVKKDGASLYATRDIATAHYRKETYDFYKSLYVVAYQQNLHFQQFFKVLELEGCEWVKDMVHVSYGMVSLTEGAMSTRKGNVVWLVDVLNMAVNKALETINEKNPELKDKEDIAEAIGVGAVMFSTLCNARIKDIVFSFDRVLSFDGETAPYLQYTHTRCCSLIEKAGEIDKNVHADYTALSNLTAKELAKLVNDFPGVVRESALKYEPSIISKYLINLAQAFNRFYLENRIVGESVPVMKARLDIVRCTKIVLSNGLKLLGIKPIEKM